MSRFAGKVALVTGGRSGIGQACARRLAAEGARLFTAQRGQCLESESLEADFSDPDAPAQVVGEVIARDGQLNVLINNAGVMEEATVEEMTFEAWQRTMAVNLNAPFLLMKHAMPHLKGGGAIVNIGSIEAIGSNPNHPAYCASKAGLHGLTRAVAVDHGGDGVRCNCVAPGWIDTELNIDFVERMPDPDGFRRELGRIHPIGRTGAPEKVASLVAWLASDEASFVTGQVYTIDGGRMSRLSLP